MLDPRDLFIARVTKGRSFIDIGGLYEIVKERISCAHRAGARSLTLLDMEEESCPWWHQMREHLERNGVRFCKFESADIMQVDVGVLDVVHSSGVLYHMPNPIEYLLKLRSITGEHCILTSTIAGNKLTGAGSEVVIPNGAAIFVPGLSGKEKDVVADWYLTRGYGNVTQSIADFGKLSYYRNWFIPTVPTFRSMAESVGFRIVDERPIDGCAYLCCCNPTSPPYLTLRRRSAKLAKRSAGVGMAQNCLSPQP